MVRNETLVSRVAGWADATGVALYLVAMMVGVGINFPLWSMTTGIGERFGSLILEGEIQLIRAGVGGLINLAPTVACICYVSGLLIGIPPLFIRGIRYLRQSCHLARGSVLIGLAASMAVTATALPIFVFKTYSRAIARLEKEAEQSLASIRNRLNRPDLDPEHGALIWNVYARETYLREGRRIPIPAGTGPAALYEPSEADRKLRDALRATQVQFQPPYANAVIWGLYSVACILIGLFRRLPSEELEDVPDLATPS